MSSRQIINLLANTETETATNLPFAKSRLHNAVTLKKNVRLTKNIETDKTQGHMNEFTCLSLESMLIKQIFRTRYICDSH